MLVINLIEMVSIGSEGIFVYTGGYILVIKLVNAMYIRSLVFVFISWSYVSSEKCLLKLRRYSCIKVKQLTSMHRKRRLCQPYQFSNVLFSDEGGLEYNL